jgi:hypothetical protein
LPFAFGSFAQELDRSSPWMETNFERRYSVLWCSEGRRWKNANPGANLTPLEDGRWFCSTCQEAFEVEEGVEPTECSKGHKQEESVTA